jgi:hypothetical protein
MKASNSVTQVPVNTNTTREEYCSLNDNISFTNINPDQFSYSEQHVLFNWSSVTDAMKKNKTKGYALVLFVK